MPMSNFKVKLVLDKAASRKYTAHTKKKETLAVKDDIHNKEDLAGYRPHKSLFKLWLTNSLDYLAQHSEHKKLLAEQDEYEVYVRLVEEEEMRHLSAKYKHSGESVSVLSFPCEDSRALGLPYIGDVVMCGKAVFNEAHEYHIDFKDHWGHLFIHSVLHLFSFEHGKEMEKLEDDIMKSCGLPALHSQLNK